MTTRIRQSVLIALLVGLYLLVALPLPYLLVDHDAAMLAADANHSASDIHAWLEWAAGSSLSGGKLVFFHSQAMVGSSVIPPSRIPSMLLASSLRSRGPPAL
jgi:hypothetical protein